jgi:hypothetical protein
MDMRMRTVVKVALYRVWQGCQQFGFVTPLSQEDYREVERWLPAPAIPLFRSMSQADQQHSLRVCRGLQARGCMERDMLAAALLHDVGKAGGRVPFWTRPVIVLGKALRPQWVLHVTVAPEIVERADIPRWRRALSYAWWHAEIGAQLAARVGLSERALLYIRTHHQPHGPAADLHEIDEVS